MELTLAELRVHWRVLRMDVFKSRFVMRHRVIKQKRKFLKDRFLNCALHLNKIDYSLKDDA